MPNACFKFHQSSNDPNICMDCGTHKDDHFKPTIGSPFPILPNVPSTIIEDVTKIMQPFLDRQSAERKLSDICALAAARMRYVASEEAVIDAIRTYEFANFKISGAHEFVTPKNFSLSSHCSRCLYTRNHEIHEVIKK